MILKKFMILILVLSTLQKPDTRVVNPLERPSYKMSKMLRSDFEETTQELAKIREAEEHIRRPSLFSKDYWLSRKREKMLYEKLTEIQDSSELAAELGQPTTKEEKQKQQRLEERKDRIEKYITKRASHRTRSITPETLRSYPDLTFFENQLRKYYVLSWENLAYGLTIREVEKILFILCFIRFCIYTVKYDIKTSLIICLIGLISAFLYESMLTDCIAIFIERIYLNSSLFRFAFEEHLDKVDKAPIGTRTLETYPTKFSNFVNDCGLILGYYLKKLPSGDVIVNYMRGTFLPLCKSFVHGYKKPLRSMLLYTLVLRIGKKYVPYHIQWHVMFYVLYSQFGRYIFQTYENSLLFLDDVLVPELRFEEIRYMEILHSAFIGMIIYLILLGMLHALFSQYYYIPFIVPNIEAHIGKRPKESIYSGGYTSWQDEQNLFAPSPADWKLWFGFLGKGPSDWKQNKKRRRNRKKPE